MVASETERISVAEAAKLLGVSRQTVWRLVKSGALPAARVGTRSIRISRDDLGRVTKPVALESPRKPKLYVATEADRQKMIEGFRLVDEARERITRWQKERGVGPTDAVELIREARAIRDHEMGLDTDP